MCSMFRDDLAATLLHLPFRLMGHPTSRETRGRASRDVVVLHRQPIASPRLFYRRIWRFDVDSITLSFGPGDPGDGRSCAHCGFGGHPAERRCPGPAGAHPYLPELGAGGRD